eukprot:6184207-Pleurochrysis_carterae.AAC.3
MQGGRARPDACARACNRHADTQRVRHALPMLDGTAGGRELRKRSKAGSRPGREGHRGTGGG